MAKEKKVIFEEMGMVEDTPDDLVMEIFAEAFWPGHPLGRPILGTKRTVGRFRREDLATYFARVYRPANVLIVAAGHLEHDRVRSLVDGHFAGLDRAVTPRSPGGRAGRLPGADGRPPAVAARTVTRSKKELEQVHLCLGASGFPQAHPDRYAAYVLNTVLGGSMSSRLFQNVREKRGLVYSISSGITAYADAGLVSIYAATSLDSAPEVLRLTLEEIRRAKGEPLPPSELRRAKDHIRGGLLLSLESSGARMNHLARQEIYFDRQVPLEEILGGIEAVTAGDVQRVAASAFDGRLGASLLGNLGGWRPREKDLRV
jgi:predicted Zn-dependent peptidase